MAALMNPVFVAIGVMLVTSSLVYCRPMKREANSDGKPYVLILKQLSSFSYPRLYLYPSDYVFR